MLIQKALVVLLVLMAIQGLALRLELLSIHLMENHQPIPAVEVRAVQNELTIKNILMSLITMCLIILGMTTMYGVTNAKKGGLGTRIREKECHKHSPSKLFVIR